MTANANTATAKHETAAAARRAELETMGIDSRSGVAWFRTRLLNETVLPEVERTEAALVRAAVNCGVSVADFDAVLDELLEAGLIIATVIDARAEGFGAVPSFRRGPAAR